MLSKRHPNVHVPRAAAAAAAAASAVFLVLAPGMPASAESLNPLSGNRGFLIVVEGAAAFADGDTEGPVAVGGDLSATGNAFGFAMKDPGTFRVGSDARPAALVVGGRVDLGRSGSLTVGSQGWVKLGDTGGFKVNSQSGGPTRIGRGGFDDHPRIELQTNEPASAVGQSGAIDFAGMFSAYRQRSSGLADCHDSATVTELGGGQYRIGLTEGRQNVLTLRSAELFKIKTLTFTSRPNRQTPLLINVDASSTGGLVDWSVPNFSGIGIGEASAILVNFSNAASVTLTEGAATLEGSLFAPGAAVVDRSSSNIEGAVVAKTLVAGDNGHAAGEVHSAGFAATLNTCGSGSAGGAGGTAASSGATGVAGSSAGASSTQSHAAAGASSQAAGVSAGEAQLAPSASGAAVPAPTATAVRHKGGLALTGANLVGMVLVGLLLVAAGVAVMVLTRRRTAKAGPAEDAAEGAQQAS